MRWSRRTRRPASLWIVLAAVAVLMPAVPAEAHQWSPATAMSAARAQAAGVTLRDGSVLMVGGVTSWANGFQARADAERFVPGTGWSPAGSLPAVRYEETATRLADGSVLVAGGFGTSSEDPQALRYLPSTNSWVTAGKLHFARHAHTATLLPDGRVLVAGGINEYPRAGQFTAETEIYDPGSNSWTVAASMLTPRWQHMATLLHDGRVLVAGGYQSGGAITAAKIYDPVRNRWSAVPAMKLSHADGMAVTLLNGRALVIGEQRRADLYDPVTNRWTLTGPMRYTATAAATVLRSGLVLVEGGRSARSPSGSVATAQLFDPRTNRWYDVGRLTQARDSQVAALDSDGQVVVAGGEFSPPNGTIPTALASVELFKDRPRPAMARPSLVDLGGGRAALIDLRFDGAIEVTDYTVATSTWSVPHSLSGHFTAVAASAGESGAPWLAARAENGSVLIRHGVDQGRWVRLGGRIRGEPAIVVRDKEVTVFARGVDDSLVARSLINGTWRPWQQLSTNVTADPAAASTAQGIVVAVVGRNRAVRLAPLTAHLHWHGVGALSATAVALGADASSVDLAYRGLGGKICTSPLVHYRAARVTCADGGEGSAGPGLTFVGNTLLATAVDRWRSMRWTDRPATSGWPRLD